MRIPYFSGKGAAGDRVLGTRLIVQSKMQCHLVPFVFIGERSAGQVNARLTAIVHRENQSLAHIGQITRHLIMT